MSAPDFDDLVGRITGLLISLEPVLTSDEAAEVEELLDHAELGEGLRTLAWLLVEEGKPVDETHRAEIKILATRMGIAQELPLGLRGPQGCDG